MPSMGIEVVAAKHTKTAEMKQYDNVKEEWANFGRAICTQPEPVLGPHHFPYVQQFLVASNLFLAS